MRNDQSTPSGVLPDEVNTTPGRAYTFVVTLLAAFMVGMTVVALCSTAQRDDSPIAAARSDETTTVEVAHSEFRETKPPRQITRSRLQRLGGIALGLAILSLVPSRKPLDPSTHLTPQMVAQTSGLPVLGRLFNSTASTASKASGRSGFLVRSLVSTGELVLCAAFMLTLAAFFLRPDLLTTMRQDPLNGYVAAMAHLADTVRSWLHAGPTLG